MGVSGTSEYRKPETPDLRLMRGQAYSGLRRDVYNDESWSITAIKLRKKLPLGNCSCIALLTYIPVGILLERVGVTTCMIKTKQLNPFLLE